MVGKIVVNVGQLVLQQVWWVQRSGLQCCQTIAYCCLLPVIVQGCWEALVFEFLKRQSSKVSVAAVV